MGAFPVEKMWAMPGVISPFEYPVAISANGASIVPWQLVRNCGERARSVN